MTTVVVTTQYEGLHCWPDCPLEEVAFLRDKHRHMFHVRVEVPVTHDDRQLEIIRLKRELRGILQYFAEGIEEGEPFDFGSMSCEMLAKNIAAELHLRTAMPYLIEVLEDGENGAVWRVDL